MSAQTIELNASTKEVTTELRFLSINGSLYTIPEGVSQFEFMKQLRSEL